MRENAGSDPWDSTCIFPANRLLRPGKDYRVCFANENDAFGCKKVRENEIWSRIRKITNPKPTGVVPSQSIVSMGKSFGVLQKKIHNRLTIFQTMRMMFAARFVDDLDLTAKFPVALFHNLSIFLRSYHSPWSMQAGSMCIFLFFIPRRFTLHQ